MEISHDKIRQTILEVVKEETDRNKRSSIGSHLQSASTLPQVAKKLDIPINSTAYEQMILTAFQELMNTGHFAWGLNFGNPNPPFFHVTERGNTAFQNLSRDPSNPNEYLRYVGNQCQLNDVERSYLKEAVSTFNSGHHKSAAVMIGATAECLILKLRTILIAKINKPSKQLIDWKAKTVFSAVKSILDKHSGSMQIELRDEYNAYWPALNEQIRRTRNDAGHPENIASFTFEDVHASLLMFPNIAKLTNHLMDFIQQHNF